MLPPISSESWGTEQHCYDEFERLVSSEGSGVQEPTVYVYDGLDRRDRKTVDENGAAAGGVNHHDYAYVGSRNELSRETDKDDKRKTYDYDSDGRRLGQSVTTDIANADDRQPHRQGSDAGVPNRQADLERRQRERRKPFAGLRTLPAPGASGARFGDSDRGVSV